MVAVQTMHLDVAVRTRWLVSLVRRQLLEHQQSRKQIGLSHHLPSPHITLITPERVLELLFLGQFLRKGHEMCVSQYVGV